MAKNSFQIERSLQASLAPVYSYEVFSFSISSELCPSTGDPLSREWVLTDTADNIQLGTTELEGESKETVSGREEVHSRTPRNHYRGWED